MIQRLRTQTMKTQNQVRLKIKNMLLTDFADNFSRKMLIKHNYIPPESSTQIAL